MHAKISKRRFLAGAAAATVAACFWEPIKSFANSDDSLPSPRRLNLNGKWRLSKKDENDWIDALVPGCVHTDLLNAQRISDPFYRDNEKQAQWIAETDWTYERSFEAPPEILRYDKVLLRCEGLDTIAAVFVNRKEVGLADNMFRLWEFDVKPALRAGENTITVQFASPVAYMRERERASAEAPAKFVKERAWLRKAPCSFGWDWGPVLATSGIWKNIQLEAFNRGRIGGVLVLQDLTGANARLDIQLEAEPSKPAAEPFCASVAVSLQGKIVARAEFAPFAAQGRCAVEIPQPQLWWPSGMGAQPLYDVRVELRDEHGILVDAVSKRIGLRTLKIHEAAQDRPLSFAVNGIPFFAKGANCIPLDSFATRVPPGAPWQYVKDAAAVNMNMLRFWGGGFYEDDAWFDACDELGICVWLDFKFACSAYPAFDQAFMANVRAEARDNLRRIRHHPCVAVWCGNNEVSLCNLAPEWRDNTMNPADYGKLFKELLAAEVAAAAPQANFVSGSPDCGDTHYWDVWHGSKTFESYREQSGFMSEFGYQSFPEPKTVRAFTNEHDRRTIVTPIMRWHQRSGGENCNQKMLDMICHYFRRPKDFESTLWMSQIVQGFGIKMGAERWRQIMPKATGCIFWQYNDTWPGMSWSSVDYFGRWKALHYMARRFYSPLLISARENTTDQTADLFVTSDLLQNSQGTIRWRVTNLAGDTLDSGSLATQIPARQSRQVHTLDLKHLAAPNPAHALVWLELEVAGQLASENLVLLVPPKELSLLNPNLRTSVTNSGGRFSVTVRADKPALWTWLELTDTDATFSDNFFHLPAGRDHVIQIEPKQPLSPDQLTRQLRVRSLFDTYRAEPA